MACVVFVPAPNNKFLSDLKVISPWLSKFTVSHTKAIRRVVIWIQFSIYMSRRLSAGSAGGFGGHLVWCVDDANTISLCWHQAFLNRMFSKPWPNVQFKLRTWEEQRGIKSTLLSTAGGLLRWAINAPGKFRQPFHKQDNIFAFKPSCLTSQQLNLVTWNNGWNTL